MPQPVHASPDARAVDLLVNNSVVAAGLAFPNTTDYLTISAGTQNVKVRVAGTTTTVIDANVTIAANANYDSKQKHSRRTVPYSGGERPSRAKR